MANETNIERGKALLKVLDQGQDVVRAVVAPDGTVTISENGATLQAVDVADVDLLLTFSDGTFVIIPNGALDAISDTAHSVIFNDSSVSLNSLFKMVGISNPAKAGSLRLVSENIDAAEPPVDNFSATSEEAPPETWTAPAPMAKVSSGIALAGKGPGLGGSGSGVGTGEGEVPDTIVPVATPTPPVYRNGSKADAQKAGDFVYGPDGPPTVSTALYTSSQFKLVASTGSITTEAALPAGSYDPSLASNPTSLADRAAPANQAHVEKILGSSGKDVIEHNSAFNESSSTSTWSKTIHLSFNNFAVVDGVSLTLIADLPDKVAGITLTGTDVTKNADFSNVWTVDIATYIAQHPDYKTDGIDIDVRYPVGSQIEPVDFFLEVAVDGTAQDTATGTVRVVDTVYTEMFMSLRDAVNVDDFTQTNVNDGQLLILPDGEGTPAGEHQLLILPSGGVGYEINAGSGNDTVHAGAGNDLLIGGSGADILDGGSDQHSGSGITLTGGDTASYVTAESAVVASLTTTFGYGTSPDTTSVAVAGDAAGDSFIGIENLTGSNHGDTLVGDGNNNILTGGSGDDLLEGMGGTILNGGDLIIGGGHGVNGDTASYAHAGPVSGSIGVTASLTDVTTLYGTTTPVVSGDAKGDAYVNIQNLLGSDSNDTLIGDSNSNTLTGGVGDDTLEGLGGADTLTGSDGTNDTVSYDHATAPVLSSLTLSADFTQGPTVIQAGDAEGDTYSGIENMFGSIYDDTLIGNGQNNVINGSSGDDLLEGMGGRIL